MHEYRRATCTPTECARRPQSAILWHCVSNPRRPIPPQQATPPRPPGAPGEPSPLPSSVGALPAVRRDHIPGTAPKPPSFFPSAPDGPPTMLKRDEQSVATVRQLIDTVAIPRLSLTVEREGGKATSRTVLYDGDLCRIGTHSSNDLVLQDPAVSRFHCRLVREEGAWRVRDWGSLNGTKLETVRIRDADPPVDATLTLGD